MVDPTEARMVEIEERIRNVMGDDWPVFPEDSQWLIANVRACLAALRKIAALKDSEPPIYVATGMAEAALAAIKPPPTETEGAY